MINPMQAAYVRILRKIKQKSDGESVLAKEIVHEGVEKLLSSFSEDASIIEASRKLYSTAIKTYKIPAPFIAETAKDGATLLFNKFGKVACAEIFYIFSSAITHYLALNDKAGATSLTNEGTAFFNTCNCPEQATHLLKVLEEPPSKSDMKLF